MKENKNDNGKAGIIFAVIAITSTGIGAVTMGLSFAFARVTMLIVSMVFEVIAMTIVNLLAKQGKAKWLLVLRIVTSVILTVTMALFITTTGLFGFSLF